MEFRGPSGKDKLNGFPLPLLLSASPDRPRY